MQPPALDAVEAQDVEHWADLLTHVAVELDADPDLTEQRTRQCIWLAAYEASMSTVVACRVTGISPASLPSWRDPVFTALRALADERIKDAVAGEVYRRAVTGVEQGVWHHGKLVGSERKYSDRMLELLAKRVDPDAWSDRQRTQQAVDDSAARMLRKVLADPKAYALLQEAAAVLALGAGAEDAVILAGDDG